MATNRRLLQAVTLVSMALPPLALLALVQSDTVRDTTVAFLENTPEVHHRKAVLAARAGRVDEALSHFENALASGAGSEVWLEYVQVASGANRSARVAGVWQSLPPAVVAIPDTLLTVLDGFIETGAREMIPKAVGRVLDRHDALAARRFEQSLSNRHVVEAFAALNGGMPGHPEVAQGVERRLRDVLRTQAIEMARSGQPDAALELLDGLAAGQAPSADLIADQIVVSSWTGHRETAIVRYLESPPELQLPEYVVPAVVDAWREGDQDTRMPPDALGRLLLRTVSSPDVALSLVDATRSTGQLDRARKLLAPRKGATKQDAAVTRRVRHGVEYRLAVILARDGRHDDAIALLRRLLRARPRDAMVRADLVTVLSWSGRHKQAVRTARPLLSSRAVPDYAAEALGQSRAALVVHRRPRPRPKPAVPVRWLGRGLLSTWHGE